MYVSYVFFFFFSSRRRHTRCSRDWSSDVCSSDLILKKDKEFYINLVFYEGLRAGRVVKELLGHMDDARRYEELAAKTGRALQRVFWNGQYFTDWVRGSRHGGFSSHGDMLALLFWVAGNDPAGLVPRF